ncbi:MAG: 3' terminal RNA ribose 2'-O-methyltransferase Hen1 [Actinomycetota bacterium]|nr:3' terminal RNA ribose 2'-O-methyltransferase Hen1 [Actinomycetota bacterium]
MLLTITTTHQPADELGYLLGKHPDRVHRTELSFGMASVCFPLVGPERCTAALVVDVDPVRLVRGRRGGGSDGVSLGQYVNDRPYAASSLLSVAIGRALGSALHGRCRDRPELAGTPIALELGLPAVRDADGLAERLFGPLGWTVQRTPLGDTQPGPRPSGGTHVGPPVVGTTVGPPVVGTTVGRTHVGLRLTGVQRLADALSHVYLLLPVLDDAKHHRVGPDEADKLLRAGERWLPDHPERELISRRYLRYRRHLTTPTLATLGIEPDDEPRQTPLRELRQTAVLRELRNAGARRVLDLGCGDGALLASLLTNSELTEIVGLDTSADALTRAERRLRLDDAAPAVRDRVTLLHGALTYTDTRLTGYDAAVLMEVVEHVDPERLPALVRSVFGVAAPATVLVTTPNAEYNARYPGLAAGAMRHPDHRFEWTRAQFATWCSDVARQHGYRVRYDGIGDLDDELGSPTQLAVFTRDAVFTPNAGSGPDDGAAGTLPDGGAAA